LLQIENDQKIVIIMSTTTIQKQSGDNSRGGEAALAFCAGVGGVAEDAWDAPAMTALVRRGSLRNTPVT
jgi:hypothetical protein